MSILIYIYCLLSKTGPDRCRETWGIGTREAACKPRQDFSIQKGSIFSSLWLSMMSNQRKKVGPFAPLKIGHVAIAFRKEKEKEKKIIFIKSSNLLSLPLEKFQRLLPSFHVAFSLLLHHCCLHWSSKFLFLSTPNCKEKPFSESWSLPLLRGDSNFR